MLKVGILLLVASMVSPYIGYDRLATATLFISSMIILTGSELLKKQNIIIKQLEVLGTKMDQRQHKMESRN